MFDLLTISNEIVFSRDLFRDVIENVSDDDLSQSLDKSFINLFVTILNFLYRFGSEYFFPFCI